MQKPVQDIYTCGLLAAFGLLLVYGGIQAASVLQHTAVVQADTAQAVVTADIMDAPDDDMLAGEEVATKECEVIYHRVLHGSVYLDGYPYLVSDKDTLSQDKTRYAATEEEDDMGDMYYALYTCNGVSVIADGYI